MLRLVTEGKKLDHARSLLAKALARNAQASRQTLSTPGGDVENAAIYRHSSLDLWGHVASGLWNRNRYFCGFGIGQPSWQVAIEINIPVKRLLACSGQIVEDAAGHLYYAHRGGLGGGKFSVPAVHFADLIRGFEREPIDANNRELALFVLGRINERALPEGLADYVHEPHRIREVRRSDTAYATALRKAGVPAEETGTDGYTPENDKDGTYSVKRQVAFRRLHGKVQRALAKELKKSGLELSTKRLKGGIAPDLFVRNDKGQMSILFEIKIPPGAQSTFTAIGQLSVYSSGQPRRPRQIIVSRGIPRSELFEEALRRHEIEHLSFLIDDKDRISFPQLSRLLNT